MPELNPRPSPRRILVVDDEPLIRATLAEYLTGEGFAVTACASGEDALAEAGRTPYDVALCDVQLPGIDGIEVLEQLLRISPETFVLLITAYATVDSPGGSRPCYPGCLDRPVGPSFSLRDRDDSPAVK